MKITKKYKLRILATLLILLTIGPEKRIEEKRFNNIKTTKILTQKIEKITTTVVVNVITEQEKNSANQPEENYNSFWIDEKRFFSIYKDRVVTEEEIRFLYSNYYTTLPKKFIASATYFGSDNLSKMELLYYEKAILNEMNLGFVLVASGKYGYHDELLPYLKEFINKYYRKHYTASPLLSKETSPLYKYFADGGLNRTNIDKRNQVIKKTYDDLNTKQKRLLRASAEIDTILISPNVQSKQSEKEALDSGKYVGLVSAKSPNDIGRRFLIYKDGHFIGVVLVVGTAKLSDWTGYGTTSGSSFDFLHIPLAIAKDKKTGTYWAFDFPETLYTYLGGNGGLVTNILAIDPD